MAEDKKESEAKYSTDTLVVILIVILGLISVLVAGYFWFKPKDSLGNQVIVKAVPLNTPLEDPSISIEKSYLNTTLIIPEKEDVEVLDAPKAIDPPEPKPDEVAPRPVINSINATLKKTPVTTTIVKKVEAPKQKLVTVKGYWIQVGSFSTNTAAQKTVSDLKSVGLSSRIVITDVDGKTLYRVRIGVYENKEEAYKFLDEVKKINGYETSYVSETTTQKYVNIN